MVSRLDKLHELLEVAERAHADLTNFEAKKVDVDFRDHCSELRRQVDIARETAIAKITKSSESLIQQIDEYEQKSTAVQHNVECVSIREKIRHQLDTSLSLLQQHRTAYSTLRNKLDQDGKNEIEQLDVKDNERQLNVAISGVSMQVAIFKEHTSRLTDAARKRVALAFDSNQDLLDENKLSLGELINTVRPTPISLSIGQPFDFNQLERVQAHAVLPDAVDYKFRSAVAVSTDRTHYVAIYTSTYRSMLCSLATASATLIAKQDCSGLSKMCQAGDESTNSSVLVVKNSYSKRMKCLDLRRLTLVRERESPPVDFLAGNKTLIFTAIERLQKGQVYAEVVVKRVDTLENVRTIRLEHLEFRVKHLLATDERLFVMSTHRSFFIVELTDCHNVGGKELVLRSCDMYTCSYYISDHVFADEGFVFLWNTNETKDKNLIWFDDRQGKRHVKTKQLTVRNAPRGSSIAIKRSGSRLLFSHTTSQTIFIKR